MSKEIPFSLGYEALRLLGKGMYSNIWSAFSELIANGIDAKAHKVWVYIDMTNKSDSIIEIMDDGHGMDEDDLRDKYVVIGQNKREKADEPEIQMGRKGVGKLAALFLTNKFTISSKKSKEALTNWIFDYDDKQPIVPSLIEIKQADYEMSNYFKAQEKGTIIRLFNVNLMNMADEAINGLSLTMANFFIYENLPNVDVCFFIKKANGEIIDFDKPITMNKKVAFKNMIALATNKTSTVKGNTYQYPLEYGASFETDHMHFATSVIDFKNFPEAVGVYNINRNGKNEAISYKLTGWIGIHSSIDQSEAKKNDKNFVKNKYYSPNRIRLYIRNKLAVENFLSYLKNTQQGANYIEGEVSFDLLDVDILDDITTSNRQDVDMHDGRVVLLMQILSKIVNKLIIIRNQVAKQVTEENKKRKYLLLGRAKKNAKNQIEIDLSKIGIPEDKIKQIVPFIENKFKGATPPEAKEIYKIFISHASKDKRFSDFLFFLLISKGAFEKDIFYTTNYVKAGENLQKEIIKNISEDNVLMLFLDSVNFMTSQYCLFEGGAFWATRSTYSCWHLHFDRSWIPDYIYSAEKYHVPLNNAKKIDQLTFEITAKKYKELIDVINILIEHINKSSLHNINKVIPIELPMFDTPLVMAEKGKTVLDYIDKDFKNNWIYYVIKGENDLKQDGTKRTKEEYINEYNGTVDKISK